MADERFADTSPRLPNDYFQVPASPRIWNYWMGGRDNYPVDRVAGDAWAKLYPPIFDLAKQSRKFLIRVVHHLASEAGVRQFLDIGTGLPTVQNTHEVAQSRAPESKIVYVDNDPSVLAHARALLTTTTSRGLVEYVDSDVHRPELILARARELLDFSRPVAVMFMGMLGHVQDVEEMHSIVDRVVAALPSGGYLALWDSTDTSDTYVNAANDYEQTGAVPYRLRSPEQIGRCFAGLELVEPGLVPITRWRPTDLDPHPDVDGYGAVGRKP